MSESQSTSTITENNWGRWGHDDERGALNLLTPEVVAQGLSAAKTGKVYTLSMPIERTGPHLDYRGAPQRLTLTNSTDESLFVDGFGGQPGVGANEDVVVMGTHTATHMDALSHVYADGSIYNGHPAEGMQSYAGATKCGIQNAGAVATRGVLIDVAAAKGVDRLEFGYGITAADLQEALDKQGIILRPGDAVLVRTGWLGDYLKSGEMRLDQPGLTLDAARFLSAADVAIVGSDNTSVEVQPFDEGTFLGGHIELLVKHGIHLIEHVVLDALSEDRAYEFFFMVAPLRIVGGTASPVSPVAIT